MACHAPTMPRRRVPTNDVYRVIFILAPFRRVVDGVFADAVNFFFAANDVFVIIPLPDGAPRGVADLVDLPGNSGFERTDNGR